MHPQSWLEKREQAWSNKIGHSVGFHKDILKIWKKMKDKEKSDGAIIDAIEIKSNFCPFLNKINLRKVNFWNTKVLSRDKKKEHLSL